MKKIEKSEKKLQSSSQFVKQPIYVILAIVTIVNILLVRLQGYVSVDQFFIIAALAMLVLGKGKEFVWDWLPFMVLFLLYRYLRGLVPLVNPTVHIFPMIEADMWLFGTLLPVTLQNLFYQAGQLRWYDWGATLLYISHYFVSFIVLLFFWLRDKKIFRSYSAALLLLSYLSFLTYILFPAMPPWMASEQGHIPHITKIMVEVFAAFPKSIDLFNLYYLTGANLVAAVPSLHAAYPVLLFCFVRRYSWWNWLSAAYLVLVWIIIVYLGEHYLIDAVLGGVYAVCTYLIIVKRKAIYRSLKTALIKLK